LHNSKPLDIRADFSYDGEVNLPKVSIDKGLACPLARYNLNTLADKRDKSGNFTDLSVANLFFRGKMTYTHVTNNSQMSYLDELSGRLKKKL